MHLIRKKDSPYWYAKFESPRGSGRYVSKSTRIKATSRSRRQALEVGRDIQDSLDRDHLLQSKGDGTSVLMVIDRYWSSEASKIKTADSYLQHLERISDHLGEERNYCNVDTPDVAALVEKMDGMGLGDATINRHLSVWQRMHKVAGTKMGLPVRMIDWSICRRMEPEGRNRFIEIEDVQKILAELPLRGREIFLFGLMTGCRKNQILSLSWDRAFPDEERVQVWKKHRRKNVKHFIELNPPALQILRQREAKRTNDLVFEVTNFRKEWYRALDASGIKDFTFHDVRHTSATWLARVASLQTVKEMLGHSDIKTTLRYAHVTRQDVKEAVNRMPSLGISGLITDEKKRA